MEPGAKDNDSHPPLNGLVLSGGQSTRMGMDKGELVYHGKTQRQQVYNLLAPHCRSVFVSCSVAQSERIIGIPKIIDAFQDAGPLAGIVSAFQQNPYSAWLCVACDLPFLDPATISNLVQARDPSEKATAYWNAEANFPEPLVAIWEPQAFSILKDVLNRGYQSPGKILMEMDARRLPISNASIFRNVNTMAEHDQALRDLAAAGS